MAGVREFLRTRPHIRVIPVAPHASVYNKVENTVGVLTGHAAVNAARAQLGPAAWSLLERGAAYQHNCRPKWAEPGQLGPVLSRMELLTGRRPDVSGRGTSRGSPTCIGTTHTRSCT